MFVLFAFTLAFEVSDVCAYDYIGQTHNLRKIKMQIGKINMWAHHMSGSAKVNRHEEFMCFCTSLTINLRYILQNFTLLFSEWMIIKHRLEIFLKKNLLFTSSKISLKMFSIFFLNFVKNEVNASFTLHSPVSACTRTYFIRKLSSLWRALEGKHLQKPYTHWIYVI